MSEKHTKGPKLEPKVTGQCPHCQSKDLDYSATEFCDGQNYQDVTCCDCGLAYQEWQSDEPTHIHVYAQEIGGVECDEQDIITDRGRLIAAAPDSHEIGLEIERAVDNDSDTKQIVNDDTVPDDAEVFLRVTVGTLRKNRAALRKARGE